LTILYLPDGLMGIPTRFRQWRIQVGLRKDMKTVASESIESRL
jgi:hypothetical protein